MAMFRGQRRGDVSARRVEQPLFQNPPVTIMHHDHAGQVALGRGNPSADFHLLLSEIARGVVCGERIELQQAERIHDQRRIKRKQLPRGTVRELVMTSVVHARLGAVFHPHPEQFLVATYVQFRSDQRRPQPESLGTLKGQIRAQRRKTGRRHRRAVG